MLDEQLLSYAAFLRGDLEQFLIVEVNAEGICKLLADLASSASEFTAYGYYRPHDKAPPFVN